MAWICESLEDFKTCYHSHMALSNDDGSWSFLPANQLDNLYQLTPLDDRRWLVRSTTVLDDVWQGEDEKRQKEAPNKSEATPSR